ncbi:DUF2018 family protein [Sulfurospirillum diekertiae]|nr:DUF2018 family protein [Sulfurospirillum diekertiae]
MRQVLVCYNRIFLKAQENLMLYEDEDDFFMGSPKSKFFDILFHANQDLVKMKLLEIVDRYSAMEILLEKQFGIDALEGLISTVLMDETDSVVEHNNDLFISTMGEILTQNE